MDCQQLVIYGFILLITLYVLKDVCGFSLEGFDSSSFEYVGDKQAPESSGVYASEERLSNNQVNLDVANMGIKTGKQGYECGVQQQLKASELLPSEQQGNIQKFSSEHPTGEGVLKGVNFLDAGFHVGVNTIGQSLRNANLNLRAEPANPRVSVSPWSNSTIGPDLSRKALDDETVCNASIV